MAVRERPVTPPRKVPKEDLSFISPTSSVILDSITRELERLKRKNSSLFGSVVKPARISSSNRESSDTFKPVRESSRRRRRSSETDEREEKDRGESSKKRHKSSHRSSKDHHRESHREQVESMDKKERDEPVFPVWPLEDRHKKSKIAIKIHSRNRGTVAERLYRQFPSNSVCSPLKNGDVHNEEEREVVENAKSPGAADSSPDTNSLFEQAFGPMDIANNQTHGDNDTAAAEALHQKKLEKKERRKERKADYKAHQERKKIEKELNRRERRARGRQRNDSHEKEDMETFLNSIVESYPDTPPEKANQSPTARDRSKKHQRDKNESLFNIPLPSVGRQDVDLRIQAMEFVRRNRSLDDSVPSERRSPERDDYKHRSHRRSRRNERDSPDRHRRDERRSRSPGEISSDDSSRSSGSSYRRDQRNRYRDSQHEYSYQYQRRSYSDRSHYEQQETTSHSSNHVAYGQPPPGYPYHHPPPSAPQYSHSGESIGSIPLPPTTIPPPPLPYSSRGDEGGHPRYPSADPLSYSSRGDEASYYPTYSAADPLPFASDSRDEGGHPKSKRYNRNNTSRGYQLPMNNANQLTSIPVSDEKFTFFFTKKYPFSNHYPCNKLEIDGRNYVCTEQYYMYMKAVTFKANDKAEQILRSTDPKKMKTIGESSSIEGFEKSVWNHVGPDIMRMASTAKYTQNPELRYSLFLTKGTTLVETNPRDQRWGIGLSMDDPRARSRQTWRGENLLGQILTELRDKLWIDPQYTREVRRVQKRLADTDRRRTM